MNPEIYCGASDEHVHYNNQELIQGKPVKLFGIEGTDDRTIWLDMKNCTGVLDSTSFSLLPGLEYISFDNCNFEDCKRAFSSLNKLNSLHIDKGTFPLEPETFEDNTSLTVVSLQDIKVPSNPCFQHLQQLESLSFDTCLFENLNGTLFSNLESLKGISISNCKINVIENDIFDNLSHLEGLNIRDSEIDEINFEVFLKLANLKFFSFHHNKINADVDYKTFEQISTLTTVHFDLNVYEILNFDSLPNLETVKIGYVDEGDDPKSNEIVEKLQSSGVKTEYVFCGTIECESDLEECS
ncbi:unnamed protein product [Phyllotreta striolata]|uniref:Uncharacterized protein n=1 Tax=Phyllotreta striolata TaxID=444603 RepID=A0A9N9TXM0_PHYSR|nr:unnamed protein product [Phyllotreta striolata]